MLMSPFLTPEFQVSELLRQQKTYESTHLIVNTAKVYVDGVIEARTAALLEPYIGYNDSGTPIFTVAEINALVVALDAAKVQVHYHAIGDRAIRMALDALELAQHTNGIRDSRHHVSHLELIEPEDHHRFRRLGAVANFQPLWAINDTYIYDLTIPLLGEKRSRWIYPMRTIVNTGNTLRHSYHHQLSVLITLITRFGVGQ